MARTRANFQYKAQLEAAGIVGDARHACLYCLLHTGVCVIESEWHYVFFCPLFFSNLRNCPLARASAADDDAEFYILPCPRDRFLDLLTRCAQELVLAQSLGSYNRLSLRERGRWLSETVGETLQVDQACSNFARMYCSSPGFERGVARNVRVHDGNATCLPDVIALPDGQLQ